MTAATQLYRQQTQPGFQQDTTPGARGSHAAETADAPVYSDGAAAAAAESLLAESMRRGTMDNVTVIVMLLQWE